MNLRECKSHVGAQVTWIHVERCLRGRFFRECLVGNIYDFHENAVLVAVWNDARTGWRSYLVWPSQLELVSEPSFYPHDLLGYP